MELWKVDECKIYRFITLDLTTIGHSNGIDAFLAILERIVFCGPGLFLSLIVVVFFALHANLWIVWQIVDYDGFPVGPLIYFSILIESIYRVNMTSITMNV